MKQLIESINRGILKALNESNNINLLTVLDDSDIDSMDIRTKSVNNKISVLQDRDNFIQAVNFLSNFKDETEKFKRLINNPRNFRLFKGLVEAADLDHLKKLINIGKNCSVMMAILIGQIHLI